MLVAAWRHQGGTTRHINWEFQALKWAIIKDYLYGATFDVITDNNPDICVRNGEVGRKRTAMVGRAIKL